MMEEARRAAGLLRSRGRAQVVAHIDADGICAGAIASLALERAGIESSVRFVKQLDPETISSLDAGSLIWFTDLGSGSLDALKGLDCVVTDHHAPDGEGSRLRTGGGGAPHVNPHLAGLDGSTDLSGAGATYLVALALDPANTELSALAIVGAIGDMQDSRHRRLTGTNRRVLEDGRRAGVLEWAVDVRCFGRQTRPLHKMLQYSSDPAIPGVTGSEEGALALLQTIGVRLKEGEVWRTWSQLSLQERREVASAIVLHLISRGAGHAAARRLLGEVYTLTREEEGTELRDAKEFATLLNSCGRHDRPEIGLAVCRGDRGEGLRRALSLLQGHRRSLVEGIQLVRELGVVRRRRIQYFHASDGISDTLVGVVAGMLLSSGEAGADPELPIVAFALAEDRSGVKVSARGTRALIDRGLDLSDAMRRAASVVGGSGGGHNIAAGATIPEGAEERFLEEVERVVAAQLSGGRAG
ncbi:MAG: DHHA1 domain-containing protein [Thermoplasmatota archaeon]